MSDNVRFIAVDQGNSFIKLTLFMGGEPVESYRFATDAMEDFFSMVERCDPECGAFCSVGRIDSRMVESLRLAVNGKLLILSRSTPFPVALDYDTPSTLGLDRIVLASGAAMLCKGENVMVVDAGTAVTLDVVDSTPAFRGGRITAGMKLRFESLHAFTAALPEVDASGPIPLIGYSTDTSIRSGVVLGLAGEIVDTFSSYKEKYGCNRILLTGGDSRLIVRCIDNRIPADHVPDLMAWGLLYIYKYNEI